MGTIQKSHDENRYTIFGMQILTLVRHMQKLEHQGKSRQVVNDQKTLK